MSEFLPPMRSTNCPNKYAPATFVPCTIMTKIMSSVCFMPYNTAPMMAAKSSAMMTPSLNTRYASMNFKNSPKPPAVRKVLPMRSNATFR